MSASSSAASELDRLERASESPQAAPAGFASTDSLALPRAFGRLLLLKLIARGGMGDVYLAATTGIEGAERPCVVKTVRRDHIHDGSFLARFLDEARVQSQLNHPGVAQVLEASTDENGEPYTVVEYVEGRSLSDVRARAIQLGARVGWPEALAIAIEMANALAHVHERAGSDGTPLGIVHRDLSPQNVMVGYVGEVKLIDFGTARGQNRKCHTVAGVVFAKPGYVAPEVARQQVGDARIDLYALGIMLWELCAGRRFLVGDPQKHLEEAAAGDVKVPMLADLVGAPKELDEIIQKLVANQPDERYVNAAQAAADMGRVLAMAPPGKNNERSVRGRIQSLMRTLWPHEPARSRGDFAKLLKTARAARAEVTTPVSNRVMEIAAQHMNDDPSVLSGTPYKLVEKIGEGASGVVWKGEHVELGRSLAIKVLSPGHGSASDAVERFRREARAVAKLSHPNLVQLYDFGRSLDGRVFLAMELLHGLTLDDHLTASRGMDWREAVRIAIDACQALQAAHEAGLVHRDLKPANLFLTENGTVKLLDFGVAMALADVAGADERRQKGFAIFGTPEYMAPEQVAGEAVDARCDLYALGCLLYELLTGSCPFEGPSSVVVMGKQLREIADPVRVRAPRKGIPEELEAVVLKLLAKKPESRFGTAAEVRLALAETLKIPTKRATRVRMVAGAFVAGAMALSIGAGLVSYRALHTTARNSEVALAPEITQAEVPAAVAPVAAPPSTGTMEIPDLPPPPPPVAEAAPAPAPAPAPQAPAAPSHAVAHAAVHATAKETTTASESASEPATASAPATETASATESASASATEAASGRADLMELADARSNAREHSDDPRTLKVWATAAFRAGALREARRAGEAWALRDDGAEPRVFLANVLDATGHRSDARAVLEQWIELHPDSTEARRLRSRAQIAPPRTERVIHKTDR